MTVLKAILPDVYDRLEYLRENNSLIHYTSADAAKSIIENKEIWLRNTRCMNDYSEIKHGLDLIQKSLEHLRQTRTEADHLHNILESNLIELSNSLIKDTYIFCLSEHNPEENDYGRLSMWRSYGTSKPLAIIFKKELPSKLPTNENYRSIYLLPVEYRNFTSCNNLLENRITELATNLKDLKNLISNGIQIHFDKLFSSLILVTAISTKHIGFKEEKEWRLVFNPNLIKESDSLKLEIESIKGTPQKVLKIKLDGFQPKPIERIIIGPTNDAEVLKESFIYLLHEAGYDNSENMVHISGIPLRT